MSKPVVELQHYFKSMHAAVPKRARARQLAHVVARFAHACEIGSMELQDFAGLRTHLKTYCVQVCGILFVSRPEPGDTRTTRFANQVYPPHCTLHAEFGMLNTQT